MNKIVKKGNLLIFSGSSFFHIHLINKKLQSIFYLYIISKLILLFIIKSNYIFLKLQIHPFLYHIILISFYKVLSLMKLVINKIIP